MINFFFTFLDSSPEIFNAFLDKSPIIEVNKNKISKFENLKFLFTFLMILQKQYKFLPHLRVSNVILVQYSFHNLKSYFVSNGR